jgi:Transglycosylase SLT domain
MWREIVEILMAINLSTHSVPEVRRAALATVIQDRANYADVDPYIFVAIITHESQWAERAISGDGLDYGLMQVRSINYGGDAKYLLTGEGNIKVGAYVIKRSIEFCRGWLHREPTTQEWLSVYQGSRRACHPTKLTKKFEDYAKCVQANVEDGHKYNCKHIYWPEIKSTEEQEDYNE